MAMKDNQNDETLSQKEEAVLVGSPFAEGTMSDNPLAGPVSSQEQLGHGKPSHGQQPDASEPLSVQEIRYTAIGSVVASGMVLLFAGVAAWWFPPGGTLIAALGCGLSLFGLTSGHRVMATVLLAMHVGLFITSYSRTLL